MIMWAVKIVSAKPFTLTQRCPTLCTICARPTKVDYVLRENPEVVNIGIAATTMKLNPEFW